jgi:peptidoglycan hydrolase-like protein with peptidoglycan-binding domain
MTTWKLTTVATLATVMLAAPAFAQGTTGSSGTKTEQPKAGDSMKSDTMKSSDSMKSDTMKSSDSMKSGAMRESRKGGMVMGQEHVKAAQQALKDKGHDPGMVDGRMGPKTQAALRDFQKAEGLEASGRLDAKTMQALGIEGGRTSGASSTTTGGSGSPSTTGPSGTSKSSEEKK